MKIIHKSKTFKEYFMVKKKMKAEEKRAIDQKKTKIRED
jgi:hypothetical protein